MIGVIALTLFWVFFILPSLLPLFDRFANPLEDKRQTDYNGACNCYWCGKECYHPTFRVIHLYRQHPKFFQMYDEQNDWFIFGDNIPEEPNKAGDKDE